MPLNCIPKDSYNGQFYVYFTHVPGNDPCPCCPHAMGENEAYGLIRMQGVWALECLAGPQIQVADYAVFQEGTLMSQVCSGRGLPCMRVPPGLLLGDTLRNIAGHTGGCLALSSHAGEAGGSGFF